MQPCIAKLEELTKTVPQKPKDWALDDELTCDAGSSPSGADLMCMNCCHLQAFLEDGVGKTLYKTMSRAEVQHLNK